MRIEPLDDADHLLITTFDRNGTPVPTAVRFAGTGGRYVFVADRDADEVDRINSAGRVEVAVCDRRGRIMPGAAVLAGVAAVLHPDQVEPTRRLLRRKYPVSTLTRGAGSSALRRVRGQERGESVAVEVTLTEAI